MNIIGIDLGGTNIRGAVVQDHVLSDVKSVSVSSSGTEEEVLHELFQLADQLVDKDIKAIGIGVPSVVDIDKGIVYDVQNIPSWKEVALKKYMEDRFHIPVLINNDANCFALGEKYFGKGQDYHSFIGLAIGTGIGGSIKKAYSCYEQSMWREIRDYAYPKSLEKFNIEVSTLNNGSVLGAAALCYA